MSRRPTCPSCGLAGERTSRVRVAFAEFQITRRGRAVTLETRDTVTIIYRCSEGHRWTEAIGPGRGTAVS